MIITDKREPAVYVNIEDKSYIGPTTETGRVVFGVILCDRGPHNRVTTVTSQNEYQMLFGTPDIRKCSQTHYILNRALEYTGKVLACRVMPSDAALANICISENTFNNIRAVSPVLIGFEDSPDPIVCNGTRIWRYRYTYYDDESITIPESTEENVTCLSEATDPGFPISVNVVVDSSNQPLIGSSYTFSNDIYNQYGELYFSKDSETSLTVGNGEQTLVTDTDLDLSEDEEVKIIRQTITAPFKDYLVYMIGTIASYDAGTGVLVVNVTGSQGVGTYDFWAITKTDEFEPDYIYGAMTCSLDDMANIEVGQWIHSSVDNKSLSRQIVSISAKASGTAGGGCCGDDVVIPDGDYFCLALLDQVYTGTETTSNAYTYTPFIISNIENITSDNGIDETDDFVYHFYANGAGEYYNNLVIKCTRNYEMERMFTDVNGVPYYPYIFVDFYLYLTDDNGIQNLIEGPWTVSLVRRSTNGELIRDYQGNIPAFIEDVINNNSSYVRIKVGRQLDSISGTGVEAENKRLQLMLLLVGETIIASTNVGFGGISFAKGTSGTGLYDVSGNIVPSNVLIDSVAKAYSGSLPSTDGSIENLPEYIYPFYEPDYIVSGGFPITAQYAAASLAATREDCHHLADTGMNYNNYMYDIQARQQSTDWNYWTSSLYVQYRRFFDDYTGLTIWMTPVYHALEAHLRTDNAYFISEPPCNIEKGAIGDAIKLAYHTNHTIRGDLCDKELNYTIVETNGTYFATQFTTWKRSIALKRQHVAKFTSYLKRKIPVILRDVVQRKATQYWLSQAKYRMNNLMLKYVDGVASKKHTSISSFTVSIEFDKNRSDLNVYVVFVPIMSIERINVFLQIPAEL